jgi:hypothetical protein
MPSKFVHAILESLVSIHQIGERFVSVLASLSNQFKAHQLFAETTVAARQCDGLITYTEARVALFCYQFRVL